MPSLAYQLGYSSIQQEIESRSDSIKEDLDDGTADEATELAQMIVGAIEDGYTSGVEALLSYSLEGSTIFGRFQDGDKTFGYTLTDGEIAYWQIQQQRSDSIPVYRADKQRMKGAKGKKCTIGTKCRYGCISSKKTCRLQPSPSARNLIRRAIKLAKSLIGQVTKKSKPEQKSKQTPNDIRATGRTGFSREQQAVLNRSRAERDRRAQERANKSNRQQVRPTRRSDAWMQGYAETLQWLAERDDGRKTTLSTGRKIPGRRCGGSFIAAPYTCHKHNPETEAGQKAEKAARQELAAKVRKIKGLKEMSTPNEQAKEGPAGFSSERNQQVQQKTEAEFIKRGGGSLVNRGMQRYSSEGRTRLQASTRAGHRQRNKVGEYFYTIPEKTNVAFSTRGQAARAQYSFYKSHQAAQINNAPIAARPQPTKVGGRFSIDSLTHAS